MAKNVEIDPGAVGPIENLPYLCVHGNLDVDRLADVKLCSTEGVRMLISEYGLGEGPRLTSVFSIISYKEKLYNIDIQILIKSCKKEGAFFISFMLKEVKF